MVFNSQIALTKNGYSADLATETLSRPGDSAEEDVAGSLRVKPATSRARWYDIRSFNHCEERTRTAIIEGDKTYIHVKCKTHSTLCSNHGYVKMECEPDVKTYIPALEKVVVSSCRCKAD